MSIGYVGKLGHLSGFSALKHRLRREAIARDPHTWHVAIYKTNVALFRQPLSNLLVTPSDTRLDYFCKIGSTAIGQSWSSDQYHFDMSHLSYFD